MASNFINSLGLMDFVKGWDLTFGILTLRGKKKIE